MEAAVPLAVAGSLAVLGAAVVLLWDAWPLGLAAAVGAALLLLWAWPTRRPAGTAALEPPETYPPPPAALASPPPPGFSGPSDILANVHQPPSQVSRMIVRCSRCGRSYDAAVSRCRDCVVAA